jgi:hypothetical protein
MIIGTTESGKTFLSKCLVAEFKKRGYPCAVLDPFCDPEWQADFITANGEEFLAYVKRSRNHFLFVDESGTTIGRYNPEMEWLATTSRHLGHSSFFIGHRATQVSTVIRTNSHRAFVFATDLDSAKLLAVEWREPQLVKLANLGKGEFFMVTRFPDENGTKIWRGAIDFEGRRVYSVPLERQANNAQTSGVSDGGSSDAVGVQHVNATDSGNGFGGNDNATVNDNQRAVK